MYSSLKEVKTGNLLINLSPVMVWLLAITEAATGNMDLNFLTTMIGEGFMVFFFGIELIQHQNIHN